MNPDASAPPAGLAGEISGLIETLLATERRLVELTGGEVDAVAGHDGRTFLLQRAQEQLRHGEAAKQAAILNALPAHIALLDAQGVIISVNDAWRRFGGGNTLQSLDHGIGLNYLAICEQARGAGSTEANQVAAGIRAVLAGAPSFSLEYSCHAPAELRWFLLTVTPLAEFRTHGVVVMHMNITERRQAEDARWAAKKRLRDLIDGLGASMMVGLMTPDGILVEANAPALAAVGLQAADVLGKPLVDSRWFDYSAEVQQQLRDAITRAQHGEASRYDMKIRGGDHRLIDVDFALNVVRDETGKVVFLVPSGNDITERKQAEIALRDSNEKFHQLADNITDAFWVRSADMREVHYVSPAFERIWGRSVESLYAQPAKWADFIAPEDRARVLAGFAAMGNGLGKLDLEYRIVRPDGAIRWVQTRGFNIRDATGKSVRQAGIVTDITERKQLEEQLRQAHKMEAIGTLAGGIAHDFNNILAAIGGYTELARMKLTDNPAVHGHLDSVVQAVKRAADLVRQILTFSREQPLERREIKLQPVVTECVKLLRATLPAGIELDLEAAADAPTVLADETQVLQVLMNLGTNARHAIGGRPGRIHVKIENRQVDAAQAAARPGLHIGRYVCVSLSDTGGGMNPETLRRIFEPFFTTKAPGAGTGLGLAVVHGIMDSHDGLITVHSQPGEGTLFQLYFPAYGAQSVAAAAQGSRGHGERLLLVDDEKLLIEICQRALGELGYEVEAVMQPAEALELVRAAPTRFALVITDQAMPGMTGLQLAAELRKIRPDLPIILTTGYSLTLTMERIQAAGIAQLLLKPTTVQSLGAAVHAALSGQPLTTHVSNPPY